mgnify:CR=1 FL=1
MECLLYELSNMALRDTIADLIFLLLLSWPYNPQFLLL